MSHQKKNKMSEALFIFSGSITATLKCTTTIESVYYFLSLTSGPQLGEQVILVGPSLPLWSAQRLLKVNIIFYHLHLTTQATVASIPNFLGITSYWSETDMRRINWFEKIKLVCTSSRQLAPVEEILQRIKINWTSSKSYWTWTSTYTNFKLA